MLASQVCGVLFVFLFQYGSTYRPELQSFETNGPEENMYREDYELEDLVYDDGGLVNPAKCVHAHNVMRERHQDTPDLVWDEGLAKAAQAYADILAETRVFEHDKLNNNLHGYGENLYYKDAPRIGTCADAVLSWYNEIDNYDFTTSRKKDGKEFEKAAVGHFTQLEWKTTRKVGVGIATTYSKRSPLNTVTYIVAKYTPRGNRQDAKIGESYEIDVQKPILPEKHRPRKPEELDESLCLRDALSWRNCRYVVRTGQCGGKIEGDSCYKSCHICKSESRRDFFNAF